MTLQIVTELPAGAIAESHKPVAHVDVLLDGEVILPHVEVTDGSVTLDSGRDARARTSLNVIGIDDLIPVDDTSPLNVYGTELAAYRGIETPENTFLVPLGIFGIDHSVVSDTGSAVTIAVDGRDRAARFMAPEGSFETSGFVSSGTEAGQAILDVLLMSWPGMPYDATAFASFTAPLPDVAYDEGEDRWAFASGIATAVGAELYFDRFGELTIAMIPTQRDADAVATIAEGEGGTLLNISRDWDRSRVINRWTVFGENPSNDSDAPIPRGVALDNNPSSPTYYYGRFGKRLDSTHNSYVGTAVQAADMANGLLAKTIGAPDSISFGAIVDPGRSPHDIIEVERSRLGVAARHILDSVTIPLGHEEIMTGATRITQVLA